MAPGEAIAFIGPNGAGKSTTIKLLTGILQRDTGTVSVLGLDPQRQRRRLAYRIGTVFGQKSRLWFHLPPLDTFKLLADIYDLEPRQARERIAILTEVFGIGRHLATPVRKLSLGERIRCEIAASLIHDPELLLLDEPTIGLDVVIRQRIRDLIARVNRERGVTVFLTSHDTAIDAPIAGYTITDVMFLWAVAAAGFGLGAIVCGNSAYLSRIIYQGDLDVYLTQPKPVLPNLLASRMSVSSWGDLLYGLGLFAVSQPLTPAGIGLFLLFVLLAAGVLVAVRVLYHSQTFLLGNAEDLAGLGSEQIITFSLYPGTIFDAPVVAVILHTLIPAALVAHLPADLFRAVTRGTGLDWGLLAVVIGGDAALIAASCAVFALGLRRYESGNRIGARI